MQVGDGAAAFHITVSMRWRPPLSSLPTFSGIMHTSGIVGFAAGEAHRQVVSDVEELVRGDKGGRQELLWRLGIHGPLGPHLVRGGKGTAINAGAGSRRASCGQSGPKTLNPKL